MPSIPAKNVARTRQEAQAREQEKTQTAASDPLTPWRTSLAQITDLWYELAKLSSNRAELAKELQATSDLVREAADQTIAGRKEGLELEDMSRRRDVLSHQLEAFDRAQLKVGQNLQKRLEGDLDAWGRLSAAWGLHTLQGEVARILTGIDSSPELELLAQQLAEHSAGYKSSRVSFPALSWAWSRPMVDDKLTKWSEHRSETLATLLSVGGEFLPQAEMLLTRAAALDAPPLFTLPAPAPTFNAAEIATWNEPLQGSDREFFEAICKQGGRDPNALNEQEKSIMARMMAERRRPYEKQSLGRPELIGSTTLAEEGR